MKVFLRLVLMSIAFAIFAATAWANVSLADVISDGMVLQQNQKVPVWGRADPGESVTVRFAGQSKSTIAAADGEWLIRLDPMKAKATAAMMTIAGRNTIELRNILVGEVWLVAGQSNMQRLLSETANGDAAIAGADHPQIRLFNVSRQVAFKHAPPPLARWLACSPQTIKEFSAAGYYFGVELESELRVPIGLINASYGGSQAEAWTPVEYLLASPDLKPTVDRTKIWDEERARVRVEYDEAIKKWRADADKATAAGARPSPSPAVPDSLREYRIAASIYDGMIAPLIPFYIRGAIWYQGESNAGRAYQYRDLFPLMIQSWRDEWQIGDFSFYWVQLADFMAERPEPTESAWAELREAQTLTLSRLPKTGQAVIIDLGEGQDIHPRNKQDVAKRLVRWALARDYGVAVSCQSPTYQSFERQGAKLLLTIANPGGGLRTVDVPEPRGFAVAGADKKFVWAKARITGPDRVEVWADSVPEPVAVRYAWADNPINNVYSREGLPLSPFRSDDWPGVTAGKDR